MPRFSPQRFSLILITLSLLAPACSSAHSLPLDQSTRARTVSTQTETKPVAAIVKARKANLRDQPSKTGNLVATVNKDDLLTLTDATPVGAWYHVKDKTGAEGWIHGNTIALLQTVDSAPTTATAVAEPRPPSPAVSGKSYVNVDGVRVPSPRFSETKPEAATARCRDGSYSFSLHRRGTCSYHGGVAEWF